MEMRQQLCVALLRSQKMTTMALPIRYNGIFNFRASRCYEKNCEKSMLIVHVFIFIDFVSIFAFNQLAFAFTDTISSLKIHTFAMTLWQKHSFSNINTQVNICCQIWANKTGIYWNSVDSDLSKNSKEMRKKFDREWRKKSHHCSRYKWWNAAFIEKIHYMTFGAGGIHISIWYTNVDNFKSATEISSHTAKVFNLRISCVRDNVFSASFR